MKLVLIEFSLAAKLLIDHILSRLTFLDTLLDIVLLDMSPQSDSFPRR